MTDAILTRLDVRVLADPARSRLRALEAPGALRGPPLVQAALHASGPHRPRLPLRLRTLRPRREADGVAALSLVGARLLRVVPHHGRPHESPPDLDTGDPLR